MAAFGLLLRRMSSPRWVPGGDASCGFGSEVSRSGFLEVSESMKEYWFHVSSLEVVGRLLRNAQGFVGLLRVD